MTSTTIGIDLGTTNTVVAMVYDDGPHVIPRGGGAVIPSVVRFDRTSAGPPSVGDEADRMPAAIRSIKRLMGRTYEGAIEEGSERFFASDEGGRLVRALAGDLQLEVSAGWPQPKRFWPHEIQAHILREAKAHAERCLKRPVTGATITVPAYFGDPHREATLDAARLAGLELVGHVLDEPSAAALAFGTIVGFGLHEPILIVDWGGGTLDVTVQVSDGREWQQLAIDGDLTLGGDDIDLLVARLALRKARLEEELLRDAVNQHELRRAARRAKEALSVKEETLLEAPRLLHPDTDEPIPWPAVTIRRDELESAAATLLEAALETVGRCLGHRDVARDRIGKVLLVGGSSRIPAFRRGLAALLPQARLHDDVDPMRSVALGAAIFANTKPTLSRICPYGFEVLHDDGSRTELIQANSEIPTPDFAHFGVPAYTSYPAQTIYRLTLSSFAERGGVKVPLQTQRLFGRDLPPTAQGTRVDVEIWLDENKTLQAACHVDGHAKAITLDSLDKQGRMLFSEVLDANLEAAAVLEANQEADGGLVNRLRAGFELSRSALESRSHAHAEDALRLLEDVRDQIVDRQRWARSAGQPVGDRVRERISGWIGLLEQELLPAFWGVLPAATRDAAVEGLRALRVMMQTGAPPEALEARFARVLDSLEADDTTGTAIRAFRESFLLGMPTRLCASLRQASLELRNAVLANDAPAVREAQAALSALLAEGNAAWDHWKDSDALVDATPDLVVPKELPRHGN
jgi:molecular chaperone DnaK (HSP70)